MSQPLPSLVERLTAHVQARLPEGVHDFCVQVRHEHVVLTGWTHTYYTKQRVQQCVREITDLPVTNEIEVVDAAPPRS
jgi:BON domain